MSSISSRLSSLKLESLPQSLDGVERELARRRLKEFIRQGWTVLESPATPFIDGWHLDAISEHLQAITFGDIAIGSTVIFSIPPGHMKSLTCSVSWLAWEWGPRAMPWIRSLNISYDGELSTRDSRKTKRLIRSPWYQERWGGAFRLTVDQDRRVENDKAGYRIATSTGGLATGERGDRIVFDDPHNVLKALSDKDRIRTLLFWDEAITTRVTGRTVKVIVAQRTHHRDLTGHVLAKELPGNVIHVCLPGEFEEARRYSAPPALAAKLRSPHARRDPRTRDGEALWPGKYPIDALKAWERGLGIYGYGSQVQQRPTPRGGGMFKRERATILPAAPAGVRWVRFWDLAGTKEAPGVEPAWTAGVKMGQLGDRYFVGDVRRFRGDPAEVESTIVATASQDGYAVKIGLPQDPGQAGKFQARYFVSKLPGYTTQIIIESGDKETRAEPFASQWEVGNVSLIAGLWVEPYLVELEQFAAGQFKDQVDASSGCFVILTGARPARTIRITGY